MAADYVYTNGLSQLWDSIMSLNLWIYCQYNDYGFLNGAMKFYRKCLPAAVKIVNETVAKLLLTSCEYDSV